MNKINIRTFDLNLLAVFVMLWETRSVTRAADRLALTQSAVSHALRRLRESLGDELFVNAKGGLVPTARGESLIAPVCEALEQISGALQQKTAFVPALARREFNIAAIDFVELSIAPQLIEQIGRHAPGIVVRICPIPEGAFVQQRLESGELDAVIGGERLKDIGLRSEMLAEIRLVTMIWKTEGLRHRRFPLSLYLKRPHVVIHTAGRPGTIVDQTLAQRGLQRRIGAVVQNFMAMPLIAAQTGFICNVPVRMAEAFSHRFDLSQHEPPITFAESPLLMSWHRRFDADPAHAWLLDQVRRAASTS